MNNRHCSTAICSLLAVPLAVAGLSAQEAPEPVAFVNATIIDPGQDTPFAGAVLVEGGKIRQVVSGAWEVPVGARIIDVQGRYLVPGLIDAHVHIGDFAAARRALRSGVTTARSMGAGFEEIGLRELAARGAIESPEVLASGYHVRPDMAEGFFLEAPDLADLLPVGVRTADDVRRVGRVMIEHGVDVLKVNATARAGLPETDPREPYYSVEELRALVEEGRRAGIPVAAHAHGDEGGRAAVLAGALSIEHGTYLSDTTLRLMVERGTYLVPTVAVVADLTLPGGDYDNALLQIRGRHMLPRVRETVARAHQLGVRIVAATDTGYGSESVLRLSHELMELVGVGLSPLEAVRSATTRAADLLGVGEHTGRIAAGLDADLLVLERNPLENIGAYQDLLLVMSDGRIVVDRLSW